MCDPGNPGAVFGRWPTDSDDDTGLANPPDAIDCRRIACRSGDREWHVPDCLLAAPELAVPA